LPLFDIETDGLYDEVTKIHVLSYTNDGVTFHNLFDYEAIKDFFLNNKVLIGHNVVRFDLRVISKILGIDTSKHKVYDTLPLCWYLDHDRLRHGLESYGEDYGIPKPVVEDWQGLTPQEYAHRCTEDVKINWKLWQEKLKQLKFLYKDRPEMDRFLQYLTFKMRCAAHQEEVGIKLDIDLVKSSIATLTKLQEEKYEELVQVMPPRKLYKKVSPPKNLFKKDGTPSVHGDRWFSILDELGLDRTHNDEVTVNTGEEPANPGSSEQVKDWLYSLGWKPCTFDYKRNDDGSERTVPQVRKDGELTPSVKVLIEDNPSVSVLDGLTVIQHRLSIFEGMLESQVGGRVRAEIAGLTNTLRFKHSKPLVNLPGIDKPWGKEIRGALLADEGYVFCGADMVSLESTTKRHYMYPHDPEYVAEMSKPGFDEHLDLALHAGKADYEEVELYKQHKDADDLGGNLATLVKTVAKIRKKFKPVNYSATYGVGKVKLSRTTGMSEGECGELIEAYWDRNWSVKVVADSLTVRTIGGKMWLYNPVSRFWISLRYDKDRFSSLNQSTGVFCFDSWLAQLWTRGVKGCFQAHDEILIPTKNKVATEEALKWAIGRVNEKLQLNVLLDVDSKYGDSYAAVH
jgi:DNA polymerase III epsilon subunit-like protein